MNVKLDTKEKFTVVTPVEADITANMTGELQDLLLGHVNKQPPHLILDLNNVNTIDESFAIALADLHQQFYENNASFIVCSVQKNVIAVLKEGEFLEHLNITPTQSEAWDILQMEEIERELMQDPGMDN